MLYFYTKEQVKYSRRQAVWNKITYEIHAVKQTAKDRKKPTHDESWVEKLFYKVTYTLKEETVAKDWTPRKILKHSILESLFLQNILKLVIRES